MGVLSAVVKYNPISLVWKMASADTTVEVSTDETRRSILRDAYKNASKEEQKQAALLELVSDNVDKAMNDMDAKQLASIGLDKTDKNEFRNDAVIDAVNATAISNVKASDLENIPREPGGRGRDARTKK